MYGTPGYARGLGHIHIHKKKGMYSIIGGVCPSYRQQTQLSDHGLGICSPMCDILRPRPSRPFQKPLLQRYAKTPFIRHTSTSQNIIIALASISKASDSNRSPSQVQRHSCRPGECLHCPRLSYTLLLGHYQERHHLQHVHAPDHFHRC